MTVTQTLAKFITGLNDASNIPEWVTEKAKLCLINGYGIGLASFNTPYARVAAQAAANLDGERSDGATILVNGKRSSLFGAVISNCALFHGRAQEDASGAAHLGAILIPLLTAAAETGRMPLDRLLSALIAGYEIGGLFEKTYAGKTTPAGLRASPLYGVLAAAAAAAYAMKLNQEQTAAALANAASFAGGILQSFADGTDEWRYQLGMTAHQGWVAAELARVGSISAPHAIEGRSGFVRAFARVDCNLDEVLGQLGHTWFIDRVVFKPYPVCAFNQTPVNAALSLKERLQGRPLSRVVVRMNPYETGYAGMDSRGPFHSISGTLMSIPFCIARTLQYGVPTLADMTVYDDEAVNQLIEKTELVSDESVPSLSCIIEAYIEGENEPVVEKLNMTTTDYNYNRSQVMELIRRVCSEVGVDPKSCEAIERFADAPHEEGLGTVLGQFANLRETAAAK